MLMSGGAILGVYAVFPAALWTRSRVRPRPLRPSSELPARVSVVIAAHNEAASIGQKLDDLAAQQLPPGVHSLQVVVASDGSVDETVAIARNHRSRPLVIDLPRDGKASALNHAVARADGDVILFTDANSSLGPTAVAALITPFADPDVGGVAGDQAYRKRRSGAATGERGYWSIERLLKRWESASGNVVSATGALHAVRREFVDPVPSDVTDDFYLSVGVICRGYRLVFAPDALAVEDPNDQSSAEYRRRVRIITRGLTGVWRRRQLLDPRKSGGYSVVLFVHKVARRLLFVPLAVSVVSATLLRRRAPLWRMVWIAQLAFYGLAALGAIDRHGAVGRYKIVALPNHFCLANAAAAHAVWNVATSRRYTTWAPERVTGG
jgi:cellulose synthase/poly-beta-1,6-N-acetylglucosamine synthase-like glycosyltransferase